MTALEHMESIDAIEENSQTQMCIDLMLDLGCQDLPVLKGDKLHGTITLRSCLDNSEETIKNIVLPGFASAYFNTHILDLLHIYSETPFDSIAVLGEQFEFLGILTHKSLLQGLSGSLTVEQPGAVVIVEMATHQYSSSEICRIIENENAQLLGLWMENIPDSGRIRASLKINTKNAERIVASLIRFKYEVIASFGDDDYQENVEKRFQALMKYLDI